MPTPRRHTLASETRDALARFGTVLRPSDPDGTQILLRELLAEIRGLRRDIERERFPTSGVIAIPTRDEVSRFGATENRNG